MKCIERSNFKRNKKTYFKLDNAMMCLKQLYIMIPTLGICKFWKSMKRASKARIMAKNG